MLKLSITDMEGQAHGAFADLRVCHSNVIAAMLCQAEAGAECRYWIRITGKWPERGIGRCIRDSINGFLAD